MTRKVKAAHFDNNCVPMAIAAATGLPYPEVHDACVRHGWTEEDGMDVVQRESAMRDMGVRMKWCAHPALIGATLREFIERCDPAGAYLIDTHDHTFAVLNGCVRDPEKTKKKTRMGLHGKVLGISHDRPRRTIGLNAMSNIADLVALLRGGRRGLDRHWRYVMAVAALLAVIHMLLLPLVIMYGSNAMRLIYAAISVTLLAVSLWARRKLLD